MLQSDWMWVPGSNKIMYCPKFFYNAKDTSCLWQKQRHTKGVFVYSFLSFFSLAFGKFKNWMTQKREARSNFPWASQLLAFGTIQLLDLPKANPQKCRKAETNTPYAPISIVLHERYLWNDKKHSNNIILSAHHDSRPLAEILSMAGMWTIEL
jgi:hypothetical protein